MSETTFIGVTLEKPTELWKDEKDMKNKTRTRGRTP